MVSVIDLCFHGEICLFALSGSNLLLFSLMTFPAVLKSLLDGTLVATMEQCFWISFVNRGYASFRSLHHFSGSESKSAGFSALYKDNSRSTLSETASLGGKSLL